LFIPVFVCGASGGHIRVLFEPLFSFLGEPLSRVAACWKIPYQAGRSKISRVKRDPALTFFPKFNILRANIKK
jgi:hypothetical protein